MIFHCLRLMSIFLTWSPRSLIGPIHSLLASPLLFSLLIRGIPPFPHTPFRSSWSSPLPETPSSFLILTSLTKSYSTFKSQNKIFPQRGNPGSHVNVFSKFVFQITCFVIIWEYVLKFSFPSFLLDLLNQKVETRHLHFQQKSQTILRKYKVGESLPQNKLILIICCHNTLPFCL